MKKLGLLFVILMITAGMSFAVDFTTGPESVQPGDMLISGGFALGNMNLFWFTSSLLGFTASVDYALSMYGLTLGGETGYLGGSENYIFFEYSYGAIPIMARLGYHPNLEIDNLDVYGLIKMGLAIGRYSSNDPDEGDSSEVIVGFGLGFGVGGRYFFTNNIGAFGEFGFDNYFFRDDGISVPARKFLTIGITYKM